MANLAAGISLEGYGRQAVGNPFAMNAALAAEGAFFRRTETFSAACEAVHWVCRALVTQR